MQRDDGRKVEHATRQYSARDIDLGGGASLTLGIRILSYVLVGASGVIMARALGAHDRGVYSLVTVIATYAAQLELGLSQAGIYLAGQPGQSLQRIASNNLVWIPAIGLAWLTGCLSIGLLRPDFVPETLETWHFLIFGFGGLFMLLAAMAKDLIIAAGSVRGFALVDFCEPVLRSTLIVGGILLLGFGLTGVLGGWLLALALTAGAGMLLLRRYVRVQPRLDGKLSRRQISFGLKNSVGYLVQGINSRIDVFLVAAFAGNTALGYYAVAFALAELLWQIPFAVSLMLFPKASALEQADAASTTSVTCRRVLLLTLAAVLGAAVAGPWIIRLYGAEFSAGLTAYYILLPSALCFCVYKVLSSSLAARGKPEAALIGGLASLPVTLVLGFVLIPPLGIEGAAITSLLAYSVNAGVLLYLFLRATNSSLRRTLLVDAGDLALLAQEVRRRIAGRKVVVAE